METKTAMRIMIMMMTDCDKMMKTVIVSVNKMRKLMLILLSGQLKKLMLTLLSAHCSGR